MEKDAAGYPQGHTNPGTSRTSPAAYPTSDRPGWHGRQVAEGDVHAALDQRQQEPA